MTKRLEDFIKNNKEGFDELEPGADLWERIESRLPAQFDEQKRAEKKTFSLGFVLRVAASIIVVMSISFVLYLHNEKSSGGVNLAAINPEYAQQRAHYASLVSTKRAELKTLTQADPKLYAEFNTEIATMDSVYKKLNKDIATSPDQEAVLQAMIHNLKLQTEILNQQLMVIEQFNQMKKTDGNEVKDI